MDSTLLWTGWAEEEFVAPNQARRPTSRAALSQTGARTLGVRDAVPRLDMMQSFFRHAWDGESGWLWVMWSGHYLGDMIRVWRSVVSGVELQCEDMAQEG